MTIEVFLLKSFIAGLLCIALGSFLIMYSHREQTPLPKAEKPLVVYYGKASFYGAGDGFHGRCMANGLRFNKNAMTAAHLKLRLGSRVRVFYGVRSVDLTITDRGPYVEGRILDLSEAAARKLGTTTQGVVPVSLVVLHEPRRDEKYHSNNPSCLKTA